MNKKRLSQIFVSMIFWGTGLFTLAGMISCEPDEEAVDELIDSIIKKAEALKERR